MSQDYFDLYNAQKNAAPPQQPAAFPSPYNHEIPGEPETQPTPFVMDSSDPSLPPPPPLPNPAYARPAPPPPKPKQPFSPIPLLLIAGVAFLFLGGLIFLTNTWATLPDMVRAIALLSVGVISFGVNALAEKVFKLPKTGLAFYILGCIFLPMAVAGIGAFSLFGDWFSFGGEGASLVAAATAACVAVTAFAGVYNYKHPFLAWLSMAAAAGACWCIALFAGEQAADMIGKFSLFSLLITVCAAGAIILTEWLLRTRQDSPWGKASLWWVIPLLYATALFFLSRMFLGKAELAPALCAAVLCVLLAYNRLISGKFHLGVPGMAMCLFAAFGNLVKLRVFHDTGEYHLFLFVLTASALYFLLLEAIPLLPEALRKTAGGAGAILMIPLIVSGGFLMLFQFEFDELFLFDALIVLSIVFFIGTKKHPFTKDTPYCALYAALVFLASVLGLTSENRIVYALLLVLTALTLLLQAFVNRKLWYFVLAGTACVSMLLLNLTDAIVFVMWFGTLLSLGGVIYAHLMRRQLLEKSFAWLFIPFLLTAGFSTAIHYLPKLTTEMLFTLLLAAVTLLYLLEAVVFWKHERTRGTKLYLEIASVGIGVLAFGFTEEAPGWKFLLVLLFLIFTVAFLKKRNNLWAIPHLLLLFFSLQQLISELSPLALVSWKILPEDGSLQPETAADLLQAGCYILVLAGFAVMGRILLPKFFDNEDGLRIDLPLLAGVLPIIAAAVSVDWYPSILLFLFLTVYSLLYIGRLQNRFIPALLASLFGCTTLLLHNIHDPFGLIDKLSVLNIQTLQILLYLLPLHVFLFTLLFILPASAKPGVHTARFVMYCVTMFTLLIASMNFGNVADAIILVAFSFAILVGSFAVKRLRWFTLGFAVLVVMTIHLTWEFWTSLHWGIYLFLAGLLLIVIASLYEYSARYAKEHPDAPKKKFRLFATWRW